jgi:hypothetical protein
MKFNLAIILRIYDYLTAILTGFITAMLVFWLVSPLWAIPLGMVVGMALGIAALLIVIVSLGWIAGAFEIIMPGKYIGMIVGMAGGMWKTMEGGATMIGLVTFGAFIGLVLAAIFHAYDRSLHGEQV